MTLDDVKALPPLSRILYWIRARESIKVSKDEGNPRPWTNDPILQSYRFCNVRRMDDKVSKWLLALYDEIDTTDRPQEEIVAFVALCRFINLPASLEELHGVPKPWDAEKIKKVLRTRKERGDTVFNGAYVVRGNDGEDKIASVVDYYCQPLIDNPPTIDTGSMETSHAALNERYGFGSFMAGQVVADLRWVLPGSWEDRNRWAPIGPGSKRGINRLFARPIDATVGPSQFLEELQALIEMGKETLDSSITSRLEAMDWQNCLCEFDKYERCLWGEGRPKSLYPGKE